MTRPAKRSIQLLYFPGTFGNCVQWCVERFMPGTMITDNIPWDKDGRVHQNDWPFYNIFECCYHTHIPDTKHYDDTKSTVVITFDKRHFLLVERLHYYRVVLEDKEKFLQYRNHVWLKETFGPDYTSSDAVIKELYKLFFHEKKKSWWDSMEAHISKEKNFQFPLYALLNTDALEYHLNALSDKFNLNLQIDRSILKSIVDHVNNVKPILTMNRAEEVLEAIKSNQNMDCADLDLLEQAWIETNLENQQLIFPYGTQWFKNTKQIKDFLNTRPKYLIHKHNLPWIDKTL